MKLSEHVKTIRELISTAFGNQFARLGVTAERQRDTAGLDAVGQSARAKLDAIIASHIEETGSYAGAFEKALDEYTFTLFNRLAALKVMESHRMFPEVITKRAENGGRSFGHRAWLEENPAMASEELEGLLPYIRFAFDSLGREIRLYSQDSTYDMLPYVLDLNAIIAAVNGVEEDKDVGAEIWCSDDVMGWLYESYNLSRKLAFKDSGEKIEFDKVSLTSQVYTPKWVVEFLVNNSLGKLYLEMYPDSEIKRKYKIANVPDTRVRPPKPLPEIRLIDPATGSANFLLYAFDFFYALYLDQIENYGEGYKEDDIPKLIIENNLYGVDLDDRAIQIAQLGLYVKALRKNSRVHIEKFNVVSSDFYLPDFEVVADSFSGSLAKDPQQIELIKEIWVDLQRAYQFGSLIRVGERFNAKFAQLYTKMEARQLNLFAAHEFQNLEKFKGQFFMELHNAVSVYSQKSGNGFLRNKTNDAITFLEILTQKYDVAVANPPYTDSGDFGGELKSFIETNYKKPHSFHSNLYATFVKRSLELTTDDGFFATIHPHTFMFIKSFEGVREYIINHTHIDLMVDYGLDRVNLFGPGILLDATFYILAKMSSDKPGVYFNITANLQERYKYEVFSTALDDHINGRPNDRVYLRDQSELKIIKSWPFIYWISDAFRKKFKGNSIGDSGIAQVVSGIKTGDNDRLLRYWWEVDPNKLSVNGNSHRKQWVVYTKGGDFSRWWGNYWLCVNYLNEGQEIKKSPNYNLLSADKAFRRGITYSATSTKGVSFRLLEDWTLFDMKGSSVIFDSDKETEYGLAVLNSKLSSYIAASLNGTVETQVGDIKRIPFVKPNNSIKILLEKIVKRNVRIKKKIKSFLITEVVYSGSPLVTFEKKGDLKDKIKLFLNFENHLFTQLLIDEAIINEKVFEAYDLTPEDKKKVIAREGESIGGLPIWEDARAEYLADVEATKDYPLDLIKGFVEQLPTLIYMEESAAFLREKFESLYQNNNDLEEFCVKNNINPINVWYLFRESGVLPVQRCREIALEFLIDIVREILMDDEDGIVPLVRNAGEEILIDRIEKKFQEKGLSTAHFSSFPLIIGKEIQNYLSNNFFENFSNHLNLFPNIIKTPFIWHITSGPRQGFDAYIIIYKWNRDKLFTLKSVYIEKRETALRNRQSDLINEKSAQAENEKDLIFHQLKEIESLKKKIDELLAEGYDPKLDDGVGKNIAPLQKKGIIAYDVLNAGQLKKYLNADW